MDRVKKSMKGKSITLGFDPGKSTGFAVFIGTELAETEAITGGFDGFMEWWEKNVDHGWISVADEIVMERYVPVEGFRGMDQTYSLEIQGAIRAMATVPVKLQTRSDKATLFNQNFTGDKGEMEREAWLLERGMGFATPHEMDAVTHIMVSKKRRRDMAFWRRYWA